jgi:hypothetical protein
VTEAGADASPLVLDATCLSHFARADRLDVLQDLLLGRRCWTTEIVLAELNRGLVEYPMLRHVAEQEWLLIAGLDSIAEIRLYDTWRRRVGSTERDQERPASSPQPSSTRRRRSPTIAGQPRSVGSTGWMSMAPSGCSPERAGKRSSPWPGRAPLLTHCGLTVTGCPARALASPAMHVSTDFWGVPSTLARSAVSPSVIG